MMRFGSLFTGIGGLDLAMEQLGFECAWQVEIHPYRQKVLARHWPNVTRYEDVRNIDSSVEPVDMIVAGFPCQPFSVAGKRRGADDERNLWPETIRVIRELRPRYAFLENVPGLLTVEDETVEDGRYFGTVLGELAEAGYDAEWGCFTAAEVGASHKRDRLFILAHTRHDGSEGRLTDEEGRLRESFGEPPPQGGSMAHANEGQCVECEFQEGRGHVIRGDRDVAHAEGQREPHGIATGERPGGHSGSSDAVADTSEGGLSDGSGVDGQHEVRDVTERGAAEDIESGNQREHWAGENELDVADAEGTGLERRNGQREAGVPRLEPRGDFPPGPSDSNAWARVLAEVPSLEPALCRVATGIPDRTHRLAALGDAVVPAQAAMAFRVLEARVVAIPVAAVPLLVAL